MMKKYIALFLLGAVFCSCNDWLDVTPKTEIKAEDNFKTEQGFKDAIAGVYLILNEQSLYGAELTCGMLDVMAQYYDSPPSTYQYDRSFDFTQDNPKARHAAIWRMMYTAIANLNELISYLESADQSMFYGDNYKLIRGEAYGLRAFLHFDLVRMFGPSYKVGRDTKAIPYNKSVSSTVTALSTVSQLCNTALEDLSTAMTDLRADAVLRGSITTSNAGDYGMRRYYRFNYYAAKLLEARIHMYMENYPAANSAAQEIIGQEVFYWTPPGEITAATDYRNKIFSRDLIFSLYSNTLDMNTVVVLYFDTSNTFPGLRIAESGYASLYETFTYDTDYRYYYQTLEVGSYRYSIKFQQSGNYANRIPMMRISEAYYIAAECALKSDSPDITAAVGYLNTVRNNRDIGPDHDLENTLTVDQVQEEIRKEYAKEFVNEGQLFYYHKRIDSPSISYYYQYSKDYPYMTPVEPVYVMPLPDDEIEYGGRDMETES